MLRERIFEIVGLIIVMAANLAVFWAVVRAGVTLFRLESRTKARLQLASGATSALGLITASTVLRTLTLHSWGQVGQVFAIFGLRMIVKQAMSREERRLALID